MEMRETLARSLEENSTDCAVILQLVAVVLYYDFTGFMLNIPGKCVPDVLDALKPSLNDEAFRKLVLLQSMEYLVYTLTYLFYCVGIPLV